MVDQAATIDTAAITKTVNDALATAMKPINDAITALAGSQKTIAETLAAQATAVTTQPKGKEGDKGDKPEPLTLADLTKVLDARDQQRSQQQQNSEARNQFIATNLGKLPDAYKGLLGSDSGKWADEAKGIQAKFEADFKALGGKPETIGGATRDGGTTPSQQPVDISKLNPVQKIAMGLKKLPQPAVVQVAATGAAPATQTAAA